MSHVLIIDANPERGQRLSDVLRQLGSDTSLVTHLPEIMPDVDCVIGEASLLQDELAPLTKRIPVVVVADPGTIKDAVAAIHRGAEDYIALPADPGQLVAAVERATAKSTRQGSTAVGQFPLIGTSRVMADIKANVAKIGPTDSPVLIAGQSGTGKEIIARALHNSSARASAPLITMNCATIPDNLIEAELFGLENYESTAKQHSGLVEAAEGGSLFLEEIDELSAPAQARLLQVLKGENRRVGSSITTAVNVRIISATHRSIEELSKSDHFREDLYYRLNVFSFRLPPLRDRGRDVLDIANWLLKRTTERLNKVGLKFSDSAVRAMLAYAWPGNVRELENAIERAVILSDSDTLIAPETLAIEVPGEPQSDIDLTQTGDLTSLEDYFVKFVQQHQDQLTETELAEKLGISRKSLWERRQRLNIPRRKTRKRGRRQDSA